MKEIKLYNRDGANLRLVSEEGKAWKFDVDEKHQYVLEYCRIGFKEGDKEIEFVDPSGGPFLSVGQRLDKTHVIESIISTNNGIVINTVESEV